MHKVVFSSYNDISGDQLNSRHILLDTCAGESVFSNRDLFYNITQSQKHILISGVNLDSEPLVISREGNTDFGTVYYDDKCIANILSFGNIVDLSHMVRYVHTNDSYIVQMKKGGKCYLFVRDKQSNIYICDIDNMTMDKDYIDMVPKNIMIASVAENIKKYTKREVSKARKAADVMRRLGHASPGQLIKLISQGKIDNIDFVAQDISRAIDIWGPRSRIPKGENHQSQGGAPSRNNTNRYKTRSGNAYRSYVRQWHTLFTVRVQPS